MAVDVQMSGLSHRLSADYLVLPHWLALTFSAFIFVGGKEWLWSFSIFHVLFGDEFLTQQKPSMPWSFNLFQSIKTLCGHPSLPRLVGLAWAYRSHGIKGVGAVSTQAGCLPGRAAGTGAHVDIVEFMVVLLLFLHVLCHPFFPTPTIWIFCPLVVLTTGVVLGSTFLRKTWLVRRSATLLIWTSGRIERVPVKYSWLIRFQNHTGMLCERCCCEMLIYHWCSGLISSYPVFRCYRLCSSSCLPNSPLP